MKFQERVSWFKAKRKCIAKGQKLLEIYNEQENKYISQLYPNLGNSRDRVAWIGGENHANNVSCFYQLY